MIREYEADRDQTALRSCLVDLQEFERGLEPGLPRGEQMADAYLAFLLDRNAKHGGRIFLAEVDGAVAGFVSVLATVPQEEPDEAPGSYAYIADLVVHAPHRGRGVGRALLERAEGFARGSGATVLRVGVLAKNHGARRLYHRLGFTDYTVQLAKPLR